MPHWTRRTLIGSAAAATVLPAWAGSPQPHPLRTSVPSVSPRLKQPDWLAHTPGIYCATPVSGGATTLCFTEGNRWALNRQIDHFSRLPELLDKARALGLNTIYLVDWYAGDPQRPPDAAWRNKGDYLPRADLGGEPALIEGIRAVHAQGGRVISYLEPWVVSKASEVGLQHGQDWSIHDPNGPLKEPYPWDWKLCPAHRPWVDWLEARTRYIVGTLGFDGVFLDSWGFERGRVCMHPGHGHRPGDPEAFDRGVIAVAQRIQRAVQQSRDDGAVLCEGSAVPTLHAHLHASFDWGIHTLKDRALWRYPGRVFTAGWSLDAMHEILGLGHKWVLTPWWLSHAAEDATCTAAIQRLMQPPTTPFRDAVARRYFTERLYRALHQWRNAGIVQDLSVPSLSDTETPPRWYDPEHFISDAAMARHHASVVRLAMTLDKAIPQLDDLKQRVALLRSCMDARAQFEHDVRGRAARPVDTDYDDLLHRRFGRLHSWVNLGNQTRTTPEGRTIPPHRLVWASGG